MTTPTTPSIPPTPAPTGPDECPPLPAPHTFDILPPLSALLSRLLLPSPGLQINTPEAPQTADAAPGEEGARLDIHELGAQVGRIRVRIQKARQAVEGGGDVGRSCTEQEGELKGLEGRCEGLRGVLRRMGKEGGGRMDVDG
ncbi:hypothetical protein EJ06DRAFT_556870 [Trichodelitschia bisporula]|uniref:Mediator of RNA polymerase II transcription subunit 9 n=1 Tax=Trichodelitschia bisporula TaxID=703511 RepID=A0A6G1HUL0_9PEZI|nr:hypothetical protein EJ06DRAFT_556870 [Trichodelitschia bisporula]